jgi:hypothetical protein
MIVIRVSERSHLTRTLTDRRALGMICSPLGNIHNPSKLIIRGRLVRKERTPR